MEQRPQPILSWVGLVSGGETVWNVFGLLLQLLQCPRYKVDGNVIQSELRTPPPQWLNEHWAIITHLTDGTVFDGAKVKQKEWDGCLNQELSRYNSLSLD